MYSSRRRMPSRRLEGRTAKQLLLHILRWEERPYVTSRFPFQRLPPEIRNIIYHFHLLQAQDQTHLRRWDDGLSTRAEAAILNWEDGDCLTAPFEYPALSILAVSRQVYEEALGMFYHYNTLRLQSVADLRDFLDSIGPTRRAFVRHVIFDYHGDGSPAAFRLLAGCGNLKRLHINFRAETMRYGRRDHMLGAPGISHLLKIRGLEIVEFSQIGPTLDEQKEGFEETVRNALLQPKKAIKGKTPAANRKKPSKGKNVAAGKKRIIEDGEAQRTKKTK